MATAIHEELDKLKTQNVSDGELQSVKTRAKADLIRGLADNQGLALQLGITQALYGDWRELFLHRAEHRDTSELIDLAVMGLSRYSWQRAPDDWVAVESVVCTRRSGG